MGDSGVKLAAFPFFLHRRCSWACAPDPAERHGKPHCAAPCGRLHARFPWDFLRRKHADRELLVRSLLRRLRGRGDPLRGFEDLPSPSLWKGWCDWACRTAMVLDFLPWKVPKSRKRLFFGWLRCAVFADSLTFVTAFLMPMSCFALLRVKCHKTKCTGCGKCRQVCAMDVDVMDNTPKQEKSCVHLHQNLPAPRTVKAKQRVRR